MTDRQPPQPGRLPRLSPACVAEVLPWLRMAEGSMQKSLEWHRAGVNQTGHHQHINGVQYAQHAISCIRWLISVADMKSAHAGGDANAVQ